MSDRTINSVSIKISPLGHLFGGNPLFRVEMVLDERPHGRRMQARWQQVEIIKVDIPFQQASDFLIQKVEDRVVQGMHLSRDFSLEVTSPRLRRFSPNLGEGAINHIRRLFDMGVSRLGS
jgi:hypothetical protein